MMLETKIDRKPVWWTTILLTLAVVITDGFLRLIERNVNDTAFKIGKNIFNQNAPEYFPLVFLMVVFLSSYLIVCVYGMILPRLPSNLWLRGVLVGVSLYFIAYLPPVVYFGFTVRVPASIPIGRAFYGLLNYAIDGCILSYCYYRFSSNYKKN
jgi:hypothetical protein